MKLEDAPVDISTVKKVRNRIKLVGIELEGGWNTLPRGIQLVQDTSVHVTAAHRGELPSPPMPIHMIDGWVKKYYPHVVDASCGMHVHMSFDTALTYQRLMTPSYSTTIITAMREWATKAGLAATHPLWARLDGTSTYCQHKYYAEDQVKVTGKVFGADRPDAHRYTVINYCFGRFSSLECRLLPMMTTAEQSIAAIMAIINTTNAFLVASCIKHGKLLKEPKVKGSIDIDLTAEIEHYTIQT